MLNNFCFNLYAQNSLSRFLPLTLSSYLTLTLSHSHTLAISHSLTLGMLNNFCFHVYAQKSLFIGENDNVYFWTATAAAPLPVSLEFTELVPS